MIARDTFQEIVGAPDISGNGYRGSDFKKEAKKKQRAREALRRHRERRRKQVEAIGVRRWNAVKGVTAAVTEMVFGKRGVRHDCTHFLAKELYAALGEELAARLRDELNDELAIAPEEHERKQKEIAELVAEFRKGPAP